MGALGRRQTKENAISNVVRSLFVLSQHVPFSPAWWFCTTLSIYGAGGGGGEVLGVIFAGYVLQASQNPYPIIVYSVAKYRPHLGHLLENVIFTIST